MGLAWVNSKSVARQGPKDLKTLPFKFGDTCFRNDGVRGSNPLSGTTLSAGESKGSSGRALRLGPSLGTLERESRLTHIPPS